MKTLPSQNATSTALLLYLNEVKEAEASRAYLDLAHVIGVPADLLNLRMTDGRIWWNNRVQWAKKSLKDRGHLSTVKRGIWQITPAGEASANMVIGRNANSLDEEFAEVGMSLHLSRERNSAVVALFKSTLEPPTCSICGFDFFKQYGELGRSYIEAHHLVPISAAEFRGKTAVKDLVALCSNCHRMIHRLPSMDIDELRQIVLERRAAEL